MHGSILDQKVKLSVFILLFSVLVVVFAEDTKVTGKPACDRIFFCSSLVNDRNLGSYIDLVPWHYFDCRSLATDKTGLKQKDKHARFAELGVKAAKIEKPTLLDKR